MTTSLTVLAPETSSVSSLWVTELAAGRAYLADRVRQAVFDLDPLHGPQFETMDPAEALDDPPALSAAFTQLMETLTASGVQGGIPAPVETDDLLHRTVHLEIQIWRGGYELPMASSGSDLLGWCFLHGTPPAHEDSGSVTLFDPRAGSGGTAMPGLPWGREFTIRPTPGVIAVAPAWLTHAVRPLEAGQITVVAVARSLP